MRGFAFRSRHFRRCFICRRRRSCRTVIGDILIHDNPPIQSQHGRSRRLQPPFISAATRDPGFPQLPGVQPATNEFFINFAFRNNGIAVFFRIQLFTNAFCTVFRMIFDDVEDFDLVFNTDMFRLNSDRFVHLVIINADLLKLLFIFVVIGISGNARFFAGLTNTHAFGNILVRQFGPSQLLFFRRSFLFNRHQGNIIILRLPFGEGSQLHFHLFDERLYSQMPVFPYHFQQPLFAEQVPAGIHSFCNAIGIKQQDIVFSELDGIRFNGFPEQIFFR